MRERIQQELTLLQRYYGADVDYVEQGDWFLLPQYPLSDPCTPKAARISFNLRPGYPGIEPYGFFGTEELRFHGQAYSAARSEIQPPFAGNWMFFSWSPDGWTPTNDAITGSNLWGWTRSFAARLREGP